MREARVIVTTDEIKAMDLFIMMRKVEKDHPRGEFSGLCEKVVFQLEKEDFALLMDPASANKSPRKMEKFSNKNSTLDVLCNLLKTWGNCSDEMIDYLRETELTSPEKIMETL